MNPQQVAELMPRMWQELRRIARYQLSHERPGHTLQPTALVNEAYLKLAGSGATQGFEVRDVLGLASQVMRQVLIDHARKKKAIKRQDDGTLAAFSPEAEMPCFDVMEVEEALAKLRKLSPRQCDIVERRVLAGYTLEEVAEGLGLSVRTVQRDWRLARAWLRRELGESPEVS